MKRITPALRLLSMALVGLNALSTTTIQAATLQSAGVEIKRVSVEQKNSGDWHPVFFEHDFEIPPVVVMGPPSFGGDQPVTVRVRNVTTEGFEFQLDEWDYLDGKHVAETLSYIAAEPGTHTWGGLQVTAGRISSLDQDWQAKDFASAFDQAPIVFAQPVTSHGNQAATPRLRNVTGANFEIHLQLEEKSQQRNNGISAAESVDYLAFEPGSGVVDGFRFKAAHTKPEVGSQWHAIDFGTSLDAPDFFAGIQSFNGSDTATVRYSALTAEGAKVMAQEEQSRDRETAHAQESLGWLAIDSEAHNVHLEANQDEVQAGAPVTLRWNVQDDASSSLEGVTIKPGIGSVAASGERVVNPAESTMYVLQAKFRNEQGRLVSITKNVHVEVEDRAPDVSTVENKLPEQRPRLGRFTVGFQGNDKSRGDRMANAAAEFYNRNSRGKLHVVYTGAGRGNYVFKVDTTRHNNNVGGLSSYQHDVAIHEMGHKLGFGHSKMTYVNPKGRFKGKLAQDPSTVMNGRAVGAPFLIAPQYYLKGWLPEGEVALFDGSKRIYELKRISDFSGKGLSTVVITSAMWNKNNPGVGSPVFISFAHLKNSNAKEFAMHMLQGIATRLIAQKGESFVDSKMTGISVEVLDNSDPEKMTIAISLGHKE